MISVRKGPSGYLSLWRGSIAAPPPDTYLSLWKGAIPIPDPDARPRTTWRDDAKEIAAREDISVGELLGAGTCRALSWPRQELMWRMAGRRMAFAEIGRRLGRDHTTVLHGVKAHERRMTEQADA